MGDYPDSAMIALIPTTTYWCKIELPHMTLVYAGDITNLSQGSHNELAKAALSLAMSNSPVVLKVLGLDVFGDGDERVDVLRLEPTPQIMAMRSAVESWNASQYTDYKPHATVGPAGLADPMKMPQFLEFDQIMCSWGDQQTSYWFRPTRTIEVDSTYSPT